MKPTIFLFFDYRDFLISYYTYAKEEHSFFSYQYIAQKADIDTSNLAKVFQKKRHLPSHSIEKFKEILSLTEREYDYFTTMISLAKARSEEKGQLFFNKLLQLQESQPRFMGMNEYHFYANWYHTAIYGLLDCISFYGDFKNLAEKLTPAISVQQVKESINLLIKIGLVSIHENGQYRPTEKILTTGEEWKSFAIRNFQEQTIDLAKRALLKIPKTKRDITTLTFSGTDEEITKLKELTKEYRKKVIDLISQSDNGNQVYQLNMQLFPLSVE